MKGACLVNLIFAFILLMAFSTVSVGAEENPPEPIPGGGFETPGDWVINSGDVVNWTASTIYINGNLTVQSGGKLVLDNVELIMNSSVDGLNWILIEGELSFTNGRIVSKRPDIHYNITFRGTVTLRSVDISELWGDPEFYWENGILIEDADVSIDECSFHHNRGAVLRVLSSDPSITNSYFYSNGGMAAVFDDYSGGVFRDNNIYRQAFGVFVRFYADPLIESNTIFELTDYGMTFNGMLSPKAINNTIYDCGIGILLWYSNAYLEGNEIYDCYDGMDIVADSRPEIAFCTIRDNQYAGMVVNGSYALVKNSEIMGNDQDGIFMFNGSSMEILASDISNNKGDGMWLSDSYAKLNGCDLVGNRGDTFDMRDGSEVEMYSTWIEGDPQSASHFEIRLGEASEIELYDTSFNEGSVRFLDDLSRLTVGVTIQFSVTDPDMLPIYQAGIRIENSTGSVTSLTTNTIGEVSRVFDIYTQFDLNGDGDGEDAGERLTSDLNFSVSKDGYLPYSDLVNTGIGHVHQIILQPEPEVRVIQNYPENHMMQVSIGTDLLIRFDKDIDPSSVRLDIQGPGGLPVVFDIFYMEANNTIRITFTDELWYSSLYRISLNYVLGASGEVFYGPHTFSFTTEDEPLPDSDRDGIPDNIDDDDDNDGYDDSVEFFYGTDPFNPQDFPFISGGDDDDDDDIVDDDPDDDPGDVDDDLPVNVTPVDELDDRIEPTPYIDPSELDPVERTDNTTSSSDDGGGSVLVMILSSFLGVLILGGTIMMIFLSGRRQNTLKDDEP